MFIGAILVVEIMTSMRDRMSLAMHAGYNIRNGIVWGVEVTRTR